MASTLVAVTPGQIIPQADWEALSHQHGDVAGTPTLRAPTKTEMQAAALAGDEDPAFEQRPVYRYAFPDGSYVEARTAPNGQDYQIVDYKPSARFTAQHPASGTAAGGTNTYIGTNPKTGKPTEVTEYTDGRPPTYDDTKVPAAQATQGQTTTIEGTQRPDGTWDNEQPREVTRGANGQLISSKPLEGAPLQAWRDSREQSRNPGGKTDAQIRQERIDAQNLAPKPVVTSQTINGQVYITQTTPGQDGKAPTIQHFGPDGQPIAALPTAAATPKSETVKGGDGKDYTRITTVGPDGKVTIRNVGPDGADIAEIPGDPTKAPGYNATPEGAPALNTQLGHIAEDMDKFQQWLDPQVRAGKITVARADQLVAARLAAHQTALSEQTGIVNAQSTAHGQALTQRAQDLGEVQSRRSTAAGIANQTANDYMPMMSKLGTGGGLAQGASIAKAIQEARFNAQDFVNMSGGGRAVAPVTPGPALQAVNQMQLPGGPTMAPGFNPRANAIGLGAVGAVAPPGSAVGPVTAGVTATNAAAVDPTGANVQAANDATMAGSQAAFGALGVPPVAPPPPEPAPQALIQPSPSFLAASSRGHVHDPTSAIQAMIADPRIDNSVIRRVVIDDYPGFPIDEMLARRLPSWEQGVAGD